MVINAASMADRVYTTADYNGDSLIDPPASDVDMEGLEEEQHPEGIKLAILILSITLGTILMAPDATIISVATAKISNLFQPPGDIGSMERPALPIGVRL